MLQLSTGWAAPRRGRAPRRADRPVTFAVAGLLDEAPDYVDALFRQVESAWPALSAWWAREGSRPLELRGELWGAAAGTRLQYDDLALRCLVQRPPESTWDAADPIALARGDLGDAMLLLAGALAVPPLRLWT